MISKVKFQTNTLRKLSIATAAIIIVLIILDLLMTRQILPYGTASASIVEIVLFVLTVIIGYGIGTWAIIGYTGRISKELITRSRLINSRYIIIALAAMTTSVYALMLTAEYQSLQYTLSPQ